MPHSNNMNNNLLQNSEEKSNDSGNNILSKFIPYWPQLLLLTLLFMGLGFVYLRYATPIYQVSTTIMIKDESRGGSEDSKIMESFNLIADKKNLENEIRVLSSRGMMEEVVKSLHLYAPIIMEGKVKAGDAYLISPIRVEVQNLDSFVEVKKVHFDYDKNSQTVVVSNKYRYPINQFVKTPYGSLRFVPNKYKVNLPSNQKRELYFSLMSPSSVATGYLGALKLTPSKQTAIVDVSYQDPIPERAVDIIGQLISLYDKASIKERNKLVLNTLSFINEELNSLGLELETIERRVQEFKSGKQAVDISAQGTGVLQNVNDNNQKLADINLQLSILHEVELYVNNQSGDISVASTAGLKDPTLGTLLTNLQASEIEYQKLKNTVGSNNVNLLTLVDQIKKLKTGILGNIRSQQQVLEASRQSINSTNSTYNSELSGVPQKEKQLQDISRELSSKTSQYQFLLQKKQEAEMSLASTVSNTRILDKPEVSKDPVKPKKLIIYLISAFAGLGCGISLILARELLTNKVLYRSEIEKVSSMQVIGELFYKKSKDPIVIKKGKRDFEAEEFRKIRILLSYLGIDSQHKKLLLTSSISGEGKSFIASNLAVSVSLVGKRVVLIDLDLNKPTQSAIFGVEYEYGVSDFLNGIKNPEEIVYKLENYENLFFIPAGNLPDDPTEIIANQKLGELLSYLDAHFDMILIDTSPAVLVTDAYLISNLCDATLYVVRHGYTPKMIVKRFEESHQLHPLKNPAIIFNGVKSKGIFRNNYGYGKNYVYSKKEKAYYNGKMR
jgi:tyrosine-protein kinase Etk/Wzc